MNGRRDDGFTYLEVLFAVVVLASGVIGAAYALAAARCGSEELRLEATARYLVQDGVAWVRSLPRLDTRDPVFGAEAGETAVDDLDDLDGLVEAPPSDRIGVAAGPAWQRAWRVESVDVDDPSRLATKGSTTLVRVQITVSYAGAARGSTSLLLARTP